MLLIGVVLIILGLLLSFPILLWIGVILAVVGLVLLVAGGTNHPVGGRRYWY